MWKNSEDVSKMKIKRNDKLGLVQVPRGVSQMESLAKARWRWWNSVEIFQAQIRWIDDHIICIWWSFNLHLMIRKPDAGGCSELMIKTHTGPDRFVCSHQCGNVFALKGNLRKQMKTQSQPAQADNLICIWWSLNQHLMVQWIDDQDPYWPRQICPLSKGWGSHLISVEMYLRLKKIWGSTWKHKANWLRQFMICIWKSTSDGAVNWWSRPILGPDIFVCSHQAGLSKENVKSFFLTLLSFRPWFSGGLMII